MFKEIPLCIWNEKARTHLHAVRAVVEEADAPDGVEDWVIAVINHVVGGHWRQRVSLNTEKAIHKSGKLWQTVLLPFPKATGRQWQMLSLMGIGLVYLKINEFVLTFRRAHHLIWKIFSQCCIFLEFGFTYLIKLEESRLQEQLKVHT